ncbi:MAG: cell filamentation protein Fic [Coxiella sp. (in: Bacteria)]|nr:MAG: cell filamentation protein Fic [Coxiella sp. (in: g-proteobacteria)]
MTWNWQAPNWPNFEYDEKLLVDFETTFLHQAGILVGSFKHIDDQERAILTVNLISDEALKTSEIEGEYLDRKSLQSSIRRQLGLQTDHKTSPPAEQGITEMMIDLFHNFAGPLSDDILCDWHRMIIADRQDVHEIGDYRTHSEPMQVVSGRIDDPNVHFEAPPSHKMSHEMTQFITWFNNTAPTGTTPLPALTRAGIAHLYFVCIHPFEDGNGRIGRALCEKSLSQYLNQPTLIALSHVIEKHKKEYYTYLEKNNSQLNISGWLTYFAKTILDAQSYTQKLVNFLIEKSKLYDRIQDQLNSRQEKVIARLFQEGPEGFKGGLSAKNYRRIAKTSASTTTRDLRELTDKDVLIRKGELKNTRYFLNLKTKY